MNALIGYSSNDRMNQWAKILNINEELLSASEYRPSFWSDPTMEISQYPSTVDPADARTIAQDVARTRANETFFKEIKIRALMKQALLRYCSYYNVCYMQGMNEILGPLLLLETTIFNQKSAAVAAAAVGYKIDEINRIELKLSIDSFDDNDDEGVEDVAIQGTSTDTEVCQLDMDVYKKYRTNLVVFEKLIDRLAPCVFSTKSVDALQSQLVLFHLLLYYHEAPLANYLTRHGMATDIYAPSWFITIFARRLPVHIALYLWDLLLQLNKRHLVVFLAVALLKKHKRRLMTLPAESLPETLTSLRFVSTDEVDAVVAEALFLEASTPASAITQMCQLGFQREGILDIDREAGFRSLQQWSSLKIVSADVIDEIYNSDATNAISCAYTHVGTVKISGFLQKRFIIIDCSNKDVSDSNTPQSLVIEGSFPIKKKAVEAICRVAATQLSLKDGSPDLGFLSPTDAATLALLWSCNSDGIHFVIIDNPTTNTPLVTHYSNGNLEVDAIATPIKTISSEKLVASLIVLGFCRVSMLVGSSVSTIDAAVDIDTVNISSISSNSSGLSYILHSDNNGFKALTDALHLKNRGSSSSADSNVIVMPQDTLISHKIHQFTLSSSKSSHSQGSPTSWFHRQSSSSSAHQATSGSSVEEGGLLGLERVLRNLGGLQEDFLESVLIPRVNSAIDNTITFLSLSSSDSSDAHRKEIIPMYHSNASGINSSVADDVSNLVMKMHQNSSIQSSINGSLTLKEIRASTYQLAPIADDMSDLLKKLRSLEAVIRQIKTNSGKVVQYMK